MWRCSAWSQPHSCNDDNHGSPLLVFHCHGENDEGCLPDLNWPCPDSDAFAAQQQQEVCTHIKSLTGPLLLYRREIVRQVCSGKVGPLLWVRWHGPALMVTILQHAQVLDLP